MASADLPSRVMATNDTRQTYCVHLKPLWLYWCSCRTHKQKKGLLCFTQLSGGDCGVRASTTSVCDYSFGFLEYWFPIGVGLSQRRGFIVLEKEHIFEIKLKKIRYSTISVTRISPFWNWFICETSFSTRALPLAMLWPTAEPYNPSIPHAH